MPCQLSSDANVNSPQIKLLNEYLRGYDERSQGVIEKVLTKDFTRVVRPSACGEGTHSKDEYIRQIGEMNKLCNSFDCNVHSVIEAPGKVVFHSTSEMKNTLGVNTKVESIAILHIVTDESGSLKVKQLEEFNDSKAYEAVNKGWISALSSK
jgi:hypothetical protein